MRPHEASGPGHWHHRPFLFYGRVATIWLSWGSQSRQRLPVQLPKWLRGGSCCIQPIIINLQGIQAGVLGWGHFVGSRNFRVSPFGWSCRLAIGNTARLRRDIPTYEGAENLLPTILPSPFDFVGVWKLARRNCTTCRIQNLRICGHPPATVVVSFPPPGYRIDLMLANGSQRLISRGWGWGAGAV